MKKKFLAAAVGAMLLGGSAMAVTLAPQGKGDVLIAPTFMAAGGWNTEFKVINTNTKDSIVAKVEVHEPSLSKEVLDFYLYLTPGDVWTGTVKEVVDAAGVKTVRLVSSDDSSWLVPDAGVCPSRKASNDKAGFDFQLLPGSNPDASLSAGYAVIYEVRTVPTNLLQVDDIYGTLSGRSSSAPANADGSVNKWALIAAYSDLCNASDAKAVSVNNPLISGALGGNAILGDGVIGKDTSSNDLTGSVRMFNPLNGNQLLLPMTALADYNNLQYQTIGGYTGFGSNNSAANKAQVEDAIWQSDFVIPFNAVAAQGQMTFATVTFPTREAFINNSANSQYSKFVNSASTIPVGYAIRDEEEHLISALGCTRSPCAQSNYTLRDEMSVISFVQNLPANQANSTLVSTGAHAKGWVNMTIAPELSEVRSDVNWNNFGQSGAPALVTYINWQLNGSQVQGTWAYAPSTYAPAKR